MTWQITYITWIYVVTTMVSLQLVFFLYHMPRARGQDSFQWIMILSTWWSLVLTFESAAPEVGTKVIWSQFEYLANMGIPLMFLRFILGYDGEKNSLVARRYWIFWIIPVLTLLLVFTNRYHHLIWTGFSWSSAGLNILSYHHGPVFFVSMAYSLLLIVYSFFRLLWMIRTKPSAFRNRAVYLIVASLFPLLTATLYTFGFTPLEGLNIAPMGILVFGLVFLRGSAREKIFDLLPFSHQFMIGRMNDGVIVLDQDGRIVELNPASESLLGIDGEVEGKQIDEVLPYLRQAVASANPAVESNAEIRLDDTSNSWIEVSCFPLREPKGGKVGNLLLIHDISERKRTEGRLKKLAGELTELNAMKDRLYSVIGHDLRSPFNAILGFSQLLAESYDEFPDEERRQFATRINMVARSTYDLLVNLLEWSATQMGKTEFQPAEVKLREVVDDVFHVLGFNASGKGVILKNSVDENLAVWADLNMLKVIMRNLVSNGIKFSSARGTVEVLALRRAEVTDIIVADNGVGMPPQVAENLFRLDSLVTTNGTSDEKGSGLGLVLSKEFVERHQGKIRVTSETGIGSRFIVTLPGIKEKGRD